MAHILETKRYSIRTNKGPPFKLFVSRHSDALWHAGVLWYRRTGSWSQSQDVHLALNLENFVNETEQLVFEEAAGWVKKNLDPESTISQDS